MSKILDWIKAHKVATVFIILGAFFLPLIIVHFLYKWYSGIWILASTWSSGDLITYVAGFEAFIGTVSLGIVAIRQNENAISLSNRLISIEETSSLLARSPNLDVKPGDFALKEMGEIFEIDDAIFCDSSLYPLFRVKSDRWTNSYFLCTLKFTNHTSTNIIIEFQSLIFDSELNTQVEPVTNFVPLPLRLDKLHISPENEKPFGFVFDINPQDESQDRRGILTFSVRNNVSDKFLYKLIFLMYVPKGMKKGGVFITNYSHEKVD